MYLYYVYTYGRLVKPSTYAPTLSLFLFSLLGYLLALTQYKWPVEGVLRSRPGVPVCPRFVTKPIIFEVTEGSWGVLRGSFGVRGVRKSPGRGQEVPGIVFWRS